MNDRGRFITEFAASSARRFGFTRRGQSFARRSPAGDSALLKIAPARIKHLQGAEALELDIHEIFCLPTAVDLRANRQPRDQQDVEAWGRVWVQGVDPPLSAQCALLDWFNRAQSWAYTDSRTRTTVGEALAATLESEVFPRLIAMFERRWLVDYLSIANRKNPSIASQSDLRMEVLASIDRSPSNAQLEDWMNRARGADDENLQRYLHRHRHDRAD